jgi:hypothetical protein
LELMRLLKDVLSIEVKWVKLVFVCPCFSLYQIALLAIESLHQKLHRTTPLMSLSDFSVPDLRLSLSLV